MKRDSQTEAVPGSDSSAETQTIDLTSLLTGDFTSRESVRPKSLRSSLLGKLFEAIPLPALLIERNGLIAFANHACAGISKEYERILGKPFSDLFPNKKSRARVLSVLEEVFKSRRPCTDEAALEIAGSRIWARASLRSVRIGSNRAALVLVEDLTNEKLQLKMERKYSEELRRLISKSQAIEKELRESRGRLELAIKGADASLWEWHILTDSLTCDDRFSEILGYAPGEILPQRNTWAALIHPEDEPTFVQKGKREKEKGSSLVLNHVLRHTGCHSAQK